MKEKMESTQILYIHIVYSMYTRSYLASQCTWDSQFKNYQSYLFVEHIIITSIFWRKQLAKSSCEHSFICAKI